MRPTEAAAPKYALLEHERRFLVDPAQLPALGAGELIEDRYLEGGRLRLRAVTGTDGARVFKLCKKYAADDPLSAPIVNIYLDATEFAALARLPGRALSKRRHRVAGFAVDVFGGALEGLVLAEIDRPDRAAVVAAAMPGWAVREVTGEAAFTGGELCRLDAAEVAGLLVSSWGGDLAGGGPPLPGRR